MPRERSSSGQSSDLAGSEFFATLRDIGRTWIERVSAEAERGSKLSKDLIAVHSVPDAVAVCQEWMSEEMDARRRYAPVHVRRTKAYEHQHSTADEWLDEHWHIVCLQT
jgi:hypothetical protein